MESEKVHLPIIKKNTDAPVASRSRYGAPVAIVLYCLNPDFGYYRGVTCAPAPNGGAGMAQGGTPVRVRRQGLS